MKPFVSPNCSVAFTTLSAWSLTSLASVIRFAFTSVNLEHSYWESPRRFLIRSRLLCLSASMFSNRFRSVTSSDIVNRFSSIVLRSWQSTSSEWRLSWSFSNQCSTWDTAEKKNTYHRWTEENCLRVSHKVIKYYNTSIQRDTSVHTNKRTLNG